MEKRKVYRLIVILILFFTWSLSSWAETLSKEAPLDNKFKEVTPGYQVRFPQDHGLHPDFQTEWWYLTANLKDKNGLSYGIQFTLFSRGQLVSDQKQQIYFAHAALSTADKFYFAERYARADMKHAGVNASPWLAFIDHWRMTGTQSAPLPGLLSVIEADFGFELSLSSSPFFLQGEQGYSRKNNSGSIASYYYNAPFIQISGTINIEQTELQVSGQAWLDREWGSNISPLGALSWDWLSLQLNDDTALMVYRVKSGTEIHLYASLMKKSGEITEIYPAQIEWKPTSWEQIDNKNYPVEWQLEIPSQQILLSIKPLNRRQLLKAQVPYWEGAVTTTGSHQGVGYLELAGY